METVNVAVVGLGFMGAMHLQSYLKIPGARIAAICDAARLPVDGDLSYVRGNIAGAEGLKLDMTHIKATRDFEEVISDPDIDLVDLCVPTSLHARLSIAALEAGKHVVCEKPLARTATIGRTMVEAAEKATGYFMPAMCIRFWPEYAWIKETIDAGTYGRVIAAHFRRVSEPPDWSDAFRDGAKMGGALLDLHIHDSDFIQYCFGRPKAVYSTGSNHWSGAVDHIVTQYTVESGACVSGEGSWSMHQGFGFKMAYTVVFESATVEFDSQVDTNGPRLFAKGHEPQIVAVAGDDGYIGELTHMIDCIREGHPPSIVTGFDGLGAIEICEAEERSVLTGQIVSL